MTMQLKFTKQNSIKQTMAKRLIKFLLLIVIFTFAIFLLDKINFPYPKENINKDITNEIIKLK